MASGIFEPGSTDTSDVARLQVALRLTEWTGNHSDPVAAAKHIAFFMGAFSVAEVHKSEPEKAIQRIENAAKAYGIGGQAK